MAMLQPSGLLRLFINGTTPGGPVAFDTETSGLFADDGARVATVSVAWEDATGEWAVLAKKYDNLTWGIEEYTPGKQAAIASIAWPFDQGVSGTGKPEDSGQATLWPDAENLSVVEWRGLLEWLQAVGAGAMGPLLIAHNAKFDLNMMKAGCRRWPGIGVDLRSLVMWDTQVVCDMVFPLERTGLKTTAGRLFGSEVQDESKKVKAYLLKKKLPSGRWDLMPWDIIGTYADLDPRLTLMLYLRQRWEIDSNEAAKWIYSKEFVGPNAVYRAIERRHEVMRLLTTMEWRGLPYAEIESREAAIECRERAQPLVDKLPFRPTIVAAKEYYFGKGKNAKGVECLSLVPYSVTDGGAPQMTAEIVTRMIDDEMPFIRIWAEYNKVTSAASMWYDGYADRMGPDGRLRTSFRQNGTVSTRFSVERVNLQAIPQDYRLSAYSILEGLLTPRQLIALGVHLGMPGWKLWELDLAQAELRVAAMMAGCKKMLEMIAAGQDLHDFTTQALFNKTHGDPEFGKYRQVGKRGNFSLIFGSKGNTFRHMVSKETGIVLDPPQADQIVRDWNGLYPEFATAIQTHMTRVIGRQNRYGRGWIDLINGERRWFERYEDAHKAFNQRVQPNLAQFGIDWMLQTERMLATTDLQEQATRAGIGGAGLLLTIHDSQVLLLPDTEEGEGWAKDAADGGRKIWANTFDVPGDVEAKSWSGK